MAILRALLHEEHGFIISTELVVVATLLVVGLITGIQCVQSAVVGEMKDVAAAIGALNQSYCFTGKSGCWFWGCGVSSWTSGSCFVDAFDEFREPIDLGCPILDPCLSTAPPVPHPAPVIEPPHCELPLIESAPHPDACPPTGEPASARP